MKPTIFVKFWIDFMVSHHIMQEIQTLILTLCRAEVPYIRFLHKNHNRKKLKKTEAELIAKILDIPIANEIAVAI